MLGRLVDLISDGTISGRIAKDVFAHMFETGKDAASIVDEKGLKQVSDSGAIEALIDKVIAVNLDISCDHPAYAAFRPAAIQCQMAFSYPVARISESLCHCRLHKSVGEGKPALQG